MRLYGQKTEILEGEREPLEIERVARWPCA
jgi:hypothetical protein